MKRFPLLVLLLVTLSIAQDKAAPEMSNTEKLALQTISQEFELANKATKKAQDDLSAFKADFLVAHPGWKFDENKGIVKDEKAK